MNYIDALKMIYTKEKLGEIDDIGFCISLTKTLSKEPSNLKALKEIVPFLFFVSPIHYFYLLYINIPQKNYIPRTPKYFQIEEKQDSLVTAIKNIFEWSEKETLIYKDLMEEIFLTDVKTWEDELAIEKKPKKEKVKKHGKLSDI